MKKPDIKKKIKENRGKKEKSHFAEYMTASVVIGLGCGAISGFFNLIQEKIRVLRTDIMPNYLFLILMPIIGVLMVLGMKLLKQSKHGGTAAGIRALQNPKEELKPDFALGAIFSLSLTNLAESAMVREGGVFQMTIPFAHYMCNRVYKNVDKSVAAACAVAAGFSGMFGLPVFGAFFASELAHGHLRKKALFWGLVSAMFAYPVQKFIFPVSSAYTLPHIPDFEIWVLVKMVILAVAMGLFARPMCEVFYRLGKVVRLISNPYVRIAVGGIVGAAVCFAFGYNDYLCGFNAMANSAFSRELLYDPRLYYAFAVKFVVFTVMKKSGYKTGKFTQTWVIGILLGELIGGVALGLTPGFGAMIGLLTLFGATYNTPLSAIVLCMEIFPELTNSAQGIVYFFIIAIAISIARIVSGNSKIYYTQDLNVSAKEEWNR